MATVEYNNDGMGATDQVASLAIRKLERQFTAGTDGGQKALTALAGGGQTGATGLLSGFNRFATVATTADSALLPVATPAQRVVVKNAGANSMTVYPQANADVINALSANTGIAIAAGKMMSFWCGLTGQWDTMLSA